MTIEALFISQGHNYVGHHGRPPGTHGIQSVDAVECVAGRGLRGDRFFDHKPGYPGQITFFAAEVHDDLRRALDLPDAPASAYRRNVLTRGVDLTELIGREFSVQGVRFRGTGECKPCYWMDRAVAPGAEEQLQGRGGLRALILSDGWLRLSPQP